MSDPVAERLARLEAFEREHRLFETLCDDWSVWRVLRRSVHLALTTERQPSASGGKGGTAQNRLPRALAQLARQMAAPQRADLVLLTATSALRDQAGGKYRDIHFDDLLDTGLTAFKIEHRNSSGLDARSAAAQYPARLDPLAVDFLARFRSRIAPPPKPVREFCRRLSELLAAELQVDIPERWLFGTVAATRSQAWVYARLLRRLRPRAVLIADTGEYALLIASRHAGVRSIEVQHGVFEPTHADAIPTQPGVDQAALVLPDTLAAYGDFWKRTLEGTVFSGDWVVPAGSPFIDKIRALRAKRRPTETFSLLVTTQGIAREDLVRWLETLVAKAPAEFDWKLRIKLHPSYDPSVEPYRGLMTDARIEVVAGHDEPSTSALIADADLHISISSAVHFDALSVGVPTVILPLPSHEIVRFAVDGSRAFLARDPADIWTIALGRPSIADGGHDFCAPDFVANLRALIAAA